MKLKSEFIEMVRGLDCPEAEALVDALERTEPEVSVRLNPRKGYVPPTDWTEVPWWAGGFYLPERPRFTFDPAMHQGRYYVQDASSMMIGRVVSMLAAEIGRPVAYLDSCAAPGGKTTAAIDALPDGSLVVANEWDPRRAAILAENVAKWGYPQTIVTKGDTSRFAKLGSAFDIVAADVPCSGEGMMRKDATAVEQWSPSLVRECADRQREILANVWAALKPGGYLIYSTCTFNRQENEGQIAWLIDEYDAEPVAVDTDPSWGIVPAIGEDFAAMRFFPGRVRGEGLFMAVVRKPGTLTNRLTDRAAKATKPHPCADWLTDRSQFVVYEDGDDVVRAFPTRWASWLQRECKALSVVDAGVTIAKLKGRDYIPTQQLAMSQALRADAFPRCEVERATAIAYLRREAVTLPTDMPKGYVLLTYENQPLGFVKNLGNRSNNLYPAQWRILSRY